MNGVFSQEEKKSCSHISDVDVGSHITGNCIRVLKKMNKHRKPFFSKNELC